MKKLLLSLMLLAPLSMFAQQKFGHINSEQILQSMPDYQKATGDLKATATQYDNDMKALQDELKRKSDEYDKQKSTMNASKQQETEQTLQQMYQKIQQTYQDNQQALQKSQQEKMAPIQTKIMNAIEAVGKNGNYVYIMDISSGIPYISKTLSEDVTEKVKAELAKMK
jgi:outer membrane protein